MSISATIKWFKPILNKQAKFFIKFKLVSFYLRITEEPLTNAVAWARTITSLSEQEFSIICHCRTNFLNVKMQILI